MFHRRNPRSLLTLSVGSCDANRITSPHNLSPMIAGKYRVDTIATMHMFHGYFSFISVMYIGLAVGILVIIVIIVILVIYLR